MRFSRAFSRAERHLSDCSTCSTVRQPAAAKRSTYVASIARSPAAGRTASSAAFQHSAHQSPSVRTWTWTWTCDVWNVSDPVTHRRACGNPGRRPRPPCAIHVLGPDAHRQARHRAPLGGAEPQPSHAKAPELWLLPSAFLPQLISSSFVFSNTSRTLLAGRPPLATPSAASTWPTVSVGEAGRRK